MNLPRVLILRIRLCVPVLGCITLLREDVRHFIVRETGFREGSLTVKLFISLERL